MHYVLSVGDYLPDVHCPLVKVTRYLMSPDPRIDGQGKRAFFEAFGFERGYPDALVFAPESTVLANLSYAAAKTNAGDIGSAMAH